MFNFAALSAYQREKRAPLLLGNFDEADVTSPTKAQKLLQISQAAIMKHKQVVRNLRKSGKRLKKRVESLEGLLEDLKEKSMISDAASSVLKLSSGAAEEFVKRLQMPNSKEKYPADLKAFALTLNFYSAKAYNYVRETFDCHLPHPRTLRKWYNCVDGSPGFTAEAITALKTKAAEAEKKGTRLKYDADGASEWNKKVSQAEDHNYCANAYKHVSQYSHDVISYVAGFVFKKLKTSIQYLKCLVISPPISDTFFPLQIAPPPCSNVIKAFFYWCISFTAFSQKLLKTPHTLGSKVPGLSNYHHY
ncbi:hypothetical protein JTE90_007672 [Oedothorax gibbosus]|uniref:THAP9-like helix-turn-helix domain-containing protein n=1 Tax=Oedothorax gibbosus TaxID=931172 RepID=A0AAV6TKS3_9ARAC|nr:hypothetical protein JTE90_007672 [Oedothorax gibbosus]